MVFEKGPENVYIFLPISHVFTKWHGIKEAVHFSFIFDLAFSR